MPNAVNAFATAAANAGTAPKTTGKKSDGLVVVVGEVIDGKLGGADQEVAEAIDEFVSADGREKTAKAEKGMAKSTALPHCLTNFLETFAKAGRCPEKSIKFRTPEIKDGEGKVIKKASQVTLVIQDRGEQYVVSDEQMQTLIALVGEETTDEIVKHDMTFEFNNDVLNKDGIMPALGAKIQSLVTGDLAAKALKDLLAACTIGLDAAQKTEMSAALKQANEVMAAAKEAEQSFEPLLTAEQSAALLIATPRTTVRKGVVADLARLCKNDPELMRNLLEAMKSHSTQYIKA